MSGRPCKTHNNPGEHYCRDCGEMTCNEYGCDCSCFRIVCPNCRHTFSIGNTGEDT